MPGRKQDCVWLYFDKTVVAGRTGCKAKCKSCGREMQGIVARMKQHHDTCTASTCSNKIKMTVDQEMEIFRQKLHYILQESVISLCKKHFKQSINLEVDGIICVSESQKNVDHVVKIHQILCEKNSVPRQTASTCANSATVLSKKTRPVMQNDKVHNSEKEVNYNTENVKLKTPVESNKHSDTVNSKVGLKSPSSSPVGPGALVLSHVVKKEPILDLHATDYQSADMDGSQTDVVSHHKESKITGVDGEQGTCMSEITHSAQTHYSTDTVSGTETEITTRTTMKREVNSEYRYFRTMNDSEKDENLLAKERDFEDSESPHVPESQTENVDMYQAPDNDFANSYTTTERDNVDNVTLNAENEIDSGVYQTVHNDDVDAMDETEIYDNTQGSYHERYSTIEGYEPSDACSDMPDDETDLVYVQDEESDENQSPTVSHYTIDYPWPSPKSITSRYSPYNRQTLHNVVTASKTDSPQISPRRVMRDQESEVEGSHNWDKFVITKNQGISVQGNTPTRGQTQTSPGNPTQPFTSRSPRMSAADPEMDSFQLNSGRRGEKKFFCECGQGFTSLASKKRHDKTQCPRSKSHTVYRCNACGTSMKRRDYISRHLQQVHGIMNHEIISLSISSFEEVNEDNC